MKDNLLLTYIKDSYLLTSDSKLCLLLTNTKSIVKTTLQESSLNFHGFQ